MVFLEQSASVSKEVTVTFPSCCEVDGKIYKRSLTIELGVDPKFLLLTLVGVWV